MCGSGVSSRRDRMTSVAAKAVALSSGSVRTGLGTENRTWPQGKEWASTQERPGSGAAGREGGWARGKKNVPTVVGWPLPSPAGGHLTAGGQSLGSPRCFGRARPQSPLPPESLTITPRTPVRNPHRTTGHITPGAPGRDCHRMEYTPGGERRSAGDGRAREEAREQEGQASKKREREAKASKKPPPGIGGGKRPQTEKQAGRRPRGRSGRPTGGGREAPAVREAAGLYRMWRQGVHIMRDRRHVPERQE